MIQPTVDDIIIYVRSNGDSPPNGSIVGADLISIMK